MRFAQESSERQSKERNDAVSRADAGFALGLGFEASAVLASAQWHQHPSSKASCEAPASHRHSRARQHPCGHTSLTSPIPPAMALPRALGTLVVLSIAYCAEAQLKWPFQGEPRCPCSPALQSGLAASLFCHPLLYPYPCTPSCAFRSRQASRRPHNRDGAWAATEPCQLQP